MGKKSLISLYTLNMENWSGLFFKSQHKRSHKKDKENKSAATLEKTKTEDLTEQLLPKSKIPLRSMN